MFPSLIVLIDAVSQRLNSYFGANPELRQLSRKAGELQSLQQLYERVAPPSLVRSSHVLQLEGRTLLLAADNGAVAAKLRQLVPELIHLFQNGGSEVTGIQVRVQVSTLSAGRASAPVTLSATGKKRLVELADELADSPLKSALQRLAKKARPGGGG
ncbi:MAG: DUF721 domain-containing protein [Nitrosomonadales bacterium]|nr:DUF721 domain-containing protein [Nitrosomonadales bacterium]